MNKNKTILLAGASGLVGKKLIALLQNHGYQLILVTRNPQKSQQLFPGILQHLSWHDKQSIDNAIASSMAVINLSGAPIVGKRWSKQYKKELYDSRIYTTRTLVDAVKNHPHQNFVFINASAVGFYGTKNPKQPADEDTPSGKDFLARLCVDWENEAKKAATYSCRVVCIRSGIILDTHEGALPQMSAPFFWGVGGPIGLNTFYFPWIHIDDEVRIILYVLENSSVEGPINATAPDLVTNKDVARILGKVLHRPSLIPVPQFVLSLLFGEGARVITNGVQVSSKRIIHLGFTFAYAHFEEALKNLFV